MLGKQRLSFVFFYLFIGNFLQLFCLEKNQPEYYFHNINQQGAIELNTGFYLTDFTEINVEKETISFEGLLNIQWMDKSLAFKTQQGLKQKVYQGSYMIEEVYNGWRPIIYLVNESGEFDIKNQIIKVNPDGLIEMISEINVVAKVKMNLRNIPFDHQSCTAIFQVLGFNKDQVYFKANQNQKGNRLDQGYMLEDWTINDLSIHDTLPDNHRIYLDQKNSSSFFVTFHLERNPGFLFQIVIIPLILLVILSWSVFWMDIESIGDRMDLSFIGILSVVAYQIMVSENMPQISYFTLLSSFIYINYFVLCLSVLENLSVSCINKKGKPILAKRIDRISRWAFPGSYLISIIISCIYYL